MIEEEVKAKLITSITTLLDGIIYSGISYEIRARRQDQDAPLSYPSITMAFMESVPQRGFLGHRIGTHVDAEGNRNPLRGWKQKQRIYFEVSVKKDSVHEVNKAEPFVSDLTARIINHILDRWDQDILHDYHMKVDEPVPKNSVAYRSKRIGSEYSYTMTFDASITYNFYWPRYRAPSRNVYVREIKIGTISDVMDENTIQFFVLPTESE